jgi:hypothetical protein
LIPKQVLRGAGCSVAHFACWLINNKEPFLIGHRGAVRNVAPPGHACTLTYLEGRYRGDEYPDVRIVEVLLHVARVSVPRGPDAAVGLGDLRRKGKGSVQFNPNPPKNNQAIIWACADQRGGHVMHEGLPSTKGPGADVTNTCTAAARSEVSHAENEKWATFRGAFCTEN